MIRNSALDKMRDGQLALGVLLRQARTVDIAGAMAACGYDWLFIDLEHGSMSLDVAAQICSAALAVGIAPIVRTPIMDIRMAAKAMDNGALGVILPRIETVEQAKHVADSLRYSPMGHRSVIGTLPHFNFQAPPLSEAIQQMDKANMLTLLVETPTAIANIDAIAAVDGIDTLLIGSNDLTLEMGIHGQFTHPDFDAAVCKVLAVAKKHGRFVGLGGINDAAIVGKYVKLGVRMIAAGSDIQFMTSGAMQRAKTLRALQE